MKTTIDLPDALYRRAKIAAAERATTLREIVIESLERGLSGRGEPVEELPVRDRFQVDDSGWPVLKRPHGDSTVITDEFINRLRDEERV